MGFREFVGSRRTGSIGLAALTLAFSTALVTPARAQDIPTDPVDLVFEVLTALGQVVPDDTTDPLDATDPFNPVCDPTDTGACLLPFPSNTWTVADATTPTGRRVDLPVLAMPRNVAGLPIQPTEQNRNDGFSPGSALLTVVPGLDVVRTFDRSDLPERYQAQMTDPATSLAAGSPIVLVDADTGERHPFIAELDAHAIAAGAVPSLAIRPLRNFEHGHTYVVGLRNLVDSSGGALSASPGFAALRDGTAGGARQDRYDQDVFAVLETAGVARDDLVQAWDLTIASAQNLTGRAVSMRDDAFAALGDTTLADGVIDGVAPNHTITEVVDDPDPASTTQRTVRGTVEVPNFLTTPDEATIAIPDLGDFPLPGARLNYANPLTPGPNDLPVVNPLDPTRDVPFVCVIPRNRPDGLAAPTLYGHGLLGSRNEASGSSTQRLRETGYMPCAIDWTGMATGDVPNVALMLADMSNFASLPDRGQQGFIEFLMLGRALRHPDGLVTDAAFQLDGAPLFDTGTLVYDGNSQGGIMGGSLVALSVDVQRATLGVPGMNYSTLLNRSVDWEGAYAEASYVFYPNKLDQQLMFSVIQMLWDRSETNGYSHFLAADPLPDTPPHQVLFQVAYGDHQVANLAAEIAARTVDGDRIVGDLPDCRHWAVDQYYDFGANDATAEASAVLAYFDSGTPTPPNSNLDPEGLGSDPHSDPRKDADAHAQKTTFFETGRVIPTRDGGHAQTAQWPERAEGFLDEVLAQTEDGCLAPLAAGAPVPAGTVDGPGDPTSVAGGASAPPLPATGGPNRAGLVAALALALTALAVRSGRRRPGTPAVPHHRGPRAPHR